MKGAFSLTLLIVCLFTFIPMFILVAEHMVSGRDSTLQKLLDNITE